MESLPVTSGEMQDRLRSDLRLAMSGRRSQEAGVLRALIAALDNAQAPPQIPMAVTNGPVEFASGAAEVERLDSYDTIWKSSPISAAGALCISRPTET